MIRDVVFSCDDNGVKFLRVVLRSLISHYRGDVPLRINVLDGFGGHSPENRRLLAELVPAPHVLRHVSVEPILGPLKEKLLRENSRWNIFTWSSITGPDAVPDATGNLLYLDIDQLVNADVSPLFELELGDNLLAAVYENHRGNPLSSQREWEVGILPPEAERYFNVGTMVFNAEAFRREKVMSRLVEWYCAHRDVATRIDQDAFNAVCWRRVVPLGMEWGLHDRMMRKFCRGDVFDRYWFGNPPPDCLLAALKPKVFHFMGRKKPWNPNHRPYRKLYFEAMRGAGLEPPREEPLAFVHDFLNARVRRRLERREAELEDLFRRCSTEAELKAVLEERFRRHKAWHRAWKVPFEWLGIGIGLALFSVLPRRPMLALCDFASALYFRFDRRGRRYAFENLELIRPGLSPAAARLVVRRSYRNMSRAVGHAFWTCVNARRRAASAGELDAECRRFLAEHRPAVTVSGHVGCWEILSQLAFLAGHPMTSVAKRIGTPGMTRLLMRARRSIGQEIVNAEGAFKPLMNALRGGRSLGLLVDQAVQPKDGGVFVRFLGRPLPVSAAPAFFAAKAKAPVVVAWSRPLPDGRYRCEFVSSYGPEAARDVWKLTQAVASDLERVIRRHPSCWVMNYNLFSNVPTAKDLETLAAREAKMV